MGSWELKYLLKGINIMKLTKQDLQGLNIKVISFLLPTVFPNDLEG
jgi:hypothetical protein